MKCLGSVLSCALVTGVLAAYPVAAHADAGRDAPSGVAVVSPDLTATVSWEPMASLDLTGYRVEVRDPATGETDASVPVPPGATSAVVTGLPRWYEQSARVVAEYADGSAAASAWSDPFRVLSTLSLVDSTPMVQHGDGVCCETYSERRRFRLDAPMPIDVWLRPTALAFDGSGAHDGFDQTDSRWPAAVDDMLIHVPAGETMGTYEIDWWGDDWKRFEYAHYVFGFENFDHPWGGGALHLDGARQEFTIYEDDPYFWPDVLVSPTADVAAGETARVTVRLDAPAHHRTVVHYTLRDGSARSGRDFRRTGTTVVVPKGARVAHARIPTNEVGRRHDDRSFQLRVTRVENNLARLTASRSSTVHIHG